VPCTQRRVGEERRVEVPPGAVGVETAMVVVVVRDGEGGEEAATVEADEDHEQDGSGCEWRFGLFE
jgi:hypothetical protein